MEIVTKGKARGSFMWKLLQWERLGVRSCGNCYKGKGQGFIHVKIITNRKVSDKNVFESAGPLVRTLFS